MKKFKKVLALSLALAMGLSLAACNGGGETPATNGGNGDGGDVVDETEGAVINIYCWNDEFASRMAGFMPGYTQDAGGDPEASITGSLDGTKVNFIINSNQGGVYQEKLDAALKAQESAAADDKVDIFLIEADYALKYVNTDYTMNVEDLGITAADMADQYQYTQDIVTDGSGAIKGVTWQATPGLFAYRRSIAKDVLGTDDPDAVQAELADWDKFDATAAKMKAKGYTMLAGYDDAYRTFSNNMSAPWVDASGNLNWDPAIERWIEQTKTYADNGYNNKETGLWSDAWSAEQGPAGKTFGFFYSTWGINFTLLGNSLETKEADGGVAEVGNGIYGDYAVCAGPEAYYWGGTWICAATGTDNKEAVAKIMRSMTCDKDVMKKITEETQDYTNNIPAMEELGSSDYSSDFLGGQNHIALFVDAAPKIDMSNTCPYDQACNESVQAAFKDYFDGTVDYDTAKANFFAAVKTKHPEINTPE